MAIASNLGLELATVSNFFMNARRRSMDKWGNKQDQADFEVETNSQIQHSQPVQHSQHQQQQQQQLQQPAIPLISYYPENTEMFASTNNSTSVSEVKAEPVQMF